MALRCWVRTAAVAAVLAASPLFAQQKLDPAEVSARMQPYLPRSQYTFKAEARLVEVGVVVRDRNNRPVSGLGRSDFEIRDGGKRRDITAFSVHTFVAASPPAAQPAAGPRTPAASPQGVRFVGLLFDDLNSDMPQFRGAQLAAMRFVKEGLAAGDQVAVFTTTRAQVLPFTDDPARIADAIDGLRPRKRTIDHGVCPQISPYEAYLLANNLERTLLEVKVEETRRCLSLPPQGGGRGGMPPSPLSNDPAVRTVLSQANSTWMQARYTSEATLGTIRNVVDYMAGLPGGRMLLLASGGFLASTLEHEQEEIVARALRGGVVINSLDAKGLYAGGPAEMPRGGDARSIIVAQQMGTRPLEASNDALAYLAQSTGGRFFHNNNDLDAGVRQLAAVPEISYLLGFTPEGSPDGKFHKLSVRVVSGRGYSVQARPGYFAAKEEPSAPPPERRIDQELLTGNLASDLPVFLETRPGSLEEGGSGLVGLIRIDIARMAFRESSGVRQGRIVFIAALLDEQGSFVSGNEGVIDFALKENTYRALAEQGLTTRFQLQAPPGKYRLRFLAEEAEGGRLSASLHSVQIR